MRIRVLGQNLPASLAVLALIEALLAFLALYAAVSIRFQTNRLWELEQQFPLGPLLLRGLIFAAIVVICLLAFGLYSGRQRARPAGVLVRLGAALLVASGVLAVVQYFVPSLHLWRGESALAVILVGCGVLASRLLFARAVGQDIFKRQVLVYGAGSLGPRNEY